ncbi:MAG: LPS export ABC transporter periplasmic protein LptC [Candidatus Lambdaproteobacteria bacterium]|nr:LPS export ABC transporter periplasmic protein LptC [Candidatus Lambdaproteobacteria bacterium]
MLRLLLFIVFLACGAGVVYLLSTREAGRTTARSTQPLPSQVLTLETVHLRYQDGAALRLEVWAEKGAYDEQTRQMLLDTVRFNLYEIATTESPADGVGAPTAPGTAPPLALQGTAKQALIDTRVEQLDLKGSVHLLRGPDIEIRTERLMYDRAQQLVKAPQEVWIRSDTTFQKGRGLVYSIPEERMTLDVPVLYR